MRAREFLFENSPPESFKGLVEFEGLHLLVSLDGATVDIRVLSDPQNIDDQIASVALSRDGTTLYPEDLYVVTDHHRKGIARKMYDYLKSLGFKILRLPRGQLFAGRKFWEKHRGKLDDPDARMVWEQTPVNEAPIVNVRHPYGQEQPWGLVPIQTGENADYNGIRVMMRPSTFLQLAYPLSAGTINPEVEKHLFKEPEGEISSAYLNIKIPPTWFDEDKSEVDRFLRAASVSGHEGRNRMTAWMKRHGDEPVEIHLFFRDGLKRRDITDKMIAALNRGMHNQASQHPDEPPEAKKYIRGPLFRVIAS